MQQYFENRESVKSGEITSNKVYENIILANERVDKEWNSKNFIIIHSPKWDLEKHAFQMIT